MLKKSTLLISLGTFIALFLSVPSSFAQSDPIYVPLPGGVKSTLYKPDSGPAPDVAVLTVHRVSNKLSGLECTELSKRGFMVLCLNTRFDNNEAEVLFETMALDVKQGVDFLKKQPGIKNIILWGHSGGGPTTTFYQAVAENGPSYCQGPNKLVQCGNELAGLTPADGIILVDAHPGNPARRVRGMNPAIVSENRPDLLRPDLNPFNPANGFNPTGDSNYSEEFQAKYFKAQAERMNRLIDEALDIRSRIEEGKYIYTDDAPFEIPRIDGAHLLELDVDIRHSTLNPHKLIKNDGTVVTQIVETVHVPSPQTAETSKTFWSGARGPMTVASFLSANATRATDSMNGIDWCSSNNSTVCATPKISIPLLVSVFTGSQYNFLQDGEQFYEISGSGDKDIIFVEGASHGVTPCSACEKVPGQYSNTVKNYFDYVSEWINQRF